MINSEKYMYAIMKTVNEAESMNPSLVKAAVTAIGSMSGDDEVAHGWEDELHFAVLKHIAKGTCKEPEKCAKIAISTGKIEFARWCA